MDSVTTSIITAISSDVTTEAVKDAYSAVKKALRRKFGDSQAMDSLETDPASKEKQARLAQALSAGKAAADAELIALAQKLSEALEKVAVNRAAAGKYTINAPGAQVGVIGDNARIHGGLHLHYNDPGGGPGRSPSESKAQTDRQSREEDTVLMHILHLSDLHFGTEADAVLWSNQLAIDLRQELKCSRIDAVIISGDVANLAAKEEYDAAETFLKKICEEFSIDPSRLVIVPGNHDLNWPLSKKGYQLIDKEDLQKSVAEGEFIPVNDEVIRLRDDKVHAKRFAPFGRFYKKVLGTPYPLAYSEQGIIYHLKDHDLLILGLNSAWRVDHHFTARAGICPNAVSIALEKIRQNSDYNRCLKLAVWHHPLISPFQDRVVDHGFLELLAQSGFRVCLHGHLHKSSNELFRYDRSVGGRRLEIVGGGSFGAPIKEWYPGYPLQYNLLEVSAEKIKVRTRRREEINGAWKPDARWTQGPGEEPLSYYSIDLTPDLKKKKPVEKKRAEPPPSKPEPESDLVLEIPIQNYCRSALSLYKDLPLMGFRTKLRVPIRIEDIYVPLRAMVDRRVIGDACFADALDAETKLGKTGECGEIALPEAFQRAEAAGRRGIVILGDPGSGKTTHLKRVLLWTLQGNHKDFGLPADMLPVFLPLRELTDLTQGLDAFIQAQLDKPHLKTPAGFGRRLLARGRLLLLLDGLDEVADTAQRARVARWIDAALKVHDTCRFAVTCRFAGYTADARLCEAFLEMHIRPLGFDQVKTFVKNWYRIVETGHYSDHQQAAVVAGEKSAKLIGILEKPEFRARRVFELTRNPLLLTNICLVHRDRGGLPKSRVRLYDECTDVLLELWRAAGGYDTRLDARTGRRALQPAAYWLHQKEERTRARAEELVPVIEPALKNTGWPHGSAAEFLRMVRDESGLLTGWDQEHYGFMHLGFQEYLAARHIQDNCLRNPALLSGLAENFGQSWWQEVILLLLALDTPCLFEPFMEALVQTPKFAQFPDLVELCLDDAAERPLAPFLALLKTDPGKKKGLWQRQLTAFKLVEQLDDSALSDLMPQLARHPFDEIRRWVGRRDARAAQAVIPAPKGGYELVRIPGGEFRMGSLDSEEGRYDDEGPQHTVHVPDFYMGRYPVTNEEYDRFLNDNPDAREPEYWAISRFNQSRQPVVGVSWEDAQNYARWAGLQLPSEAQWEYACRAGSQTRFYSGDAEQDLGRVGWYAKNSDGKLHGVGQKEPNSFGLYDMHGNVWEWVEDDFHDNYKRAPKDGTAWIERPRGPRRVIRGGSWGYPAGYCRAAIRLGFEPGLRGDDLGFRLALLPGQQ